MPDAVDIAVLGSGPAALCMAGSLAAHGVSLGLVAPDPESPWKANYCMWGPEIPHALDRVTHRWPQTLVRASSGARVLDRAYAKLDTRAWQALLLDQLHRASAQVVDARASQVRPNGRGLEICSPTGAVLRAKVVVDATGAESPFVRRVHARPPAYQRAFGLLLDAPDHPFDRNQAVLMDFTPADPEEPDPPSFLYVLPLLDGRLFVEETSLARRPALDFDTLAGRLETRLVGWGLSSRPRLSTEHCHIAMGLGLPRARQDVVPFGAAAAMVHPASGYLQARVVRKAPLVASAIVEALAQDGERAATDRGNDALWSVPERKAWELYAVGLESLVDMSAAQVSKFFGAFFELPTASWAGFLSGTLDPSELRAVMTELFRKLPMPLRWRLLRSSVTAGAAPLARSLMPQVPHESIS